MNIHTSRGSRSWIVAGTFGAVIVSSLTACIYVPSRRKAAAREAAYFSAHPELPPSIAKAIDQGHVLLGMTKEQVWVVLGDPAHKRVFGENGSIEIWLFPAHRLHQDQLHSHGTSSFRLTFIDGRLIVLEPI